MKKSKIILMVLAIAILSLTFVGCIDNGSNLLFEYKGVSETKDDTPLKYVELLVVNNDSQRLQEFSASDFYIISNGTKENGISFITGSQFTDFNGDKTYTSTTKPSYNVNFDEAATLQIVFTSVEKITEIYYKDTKIPLSTVTVS